jgi:hypothetical protein
VYKYEFVLISLQVCFYGIYAVARGTRRARRENAGKLFPLRTILLEATLMCHSNRNHSKITGFIVVRQDENPHSEEGIFNVLPAMHLLND